MCQMEKELNDGTITVERERPERRARILISLSAEVVDKIDAAAAAWGIGRSTYLEIVMREHFGNKKLLG